MHLNFHICVTRFNNETFKQYKLYKQKHKIIGCIYGTPIKINNINILPYDNIIILEMNNSINKIEGIGIIKNKIYFKKYCNIFTNQNYNRYIYLSNYYINHFTLYETYIIKNLEFLLFKTKQHFKRGQGIQILPSHILYNTYFNYKQFLINLYLSRFKYINKNKIIIINNNTFN